MKKKIIIIFSLILSILFINITPVYCLPAIDFSDGEEDDEGNYLEGPDFSDERYPYRFDYNIFNPNIIPFFVNKTTGEGFYYTGYIPEITFKENKINSTDYENFVGDAVLYNVGAEDNPKVQEQEIYVALSTMKTHLYYYNPTNNSLELICNGSRFYEPQAVYNSNVYLYLKNFIGFGVTDSDYATLQTFLDNDWEFMNYVLTQSDGMRLYDIKYGEKNSLLGIYPKYLENIFPYRVEKYKYTILDYHQNIYYNGFWEYSVTTNVVNSYYYDTNNVSVRDLIATFYSKSGTYNNDSYMIYEYSIYSPDVRPSGKLGIVFDYYNTYTKIYERVYTSYDELLELGVIDESLEIVDSKKIYTNNMNCSLLLKIGDIKKLSHFGDIQDICVLGCGIYWEMPNGNAYDNTLKTYTYSHAISNSSYVAFSYKDTTQNVIPATVKGYRLSTNCNNWSRYYYSSPKSTDDTPISNGVPGNDSLSGLLDGLDITSFVDMVGNVPLAFRMFFLKIPPVFVGLFGFSLTLFCISAIINYLRR